MTYICLSSAYSLSPFMHQALSAHPILINAPSPAVHMPADQMGLVQAETLWSAAAVEYCSFLGPQVPLSCETVLVLQLQGEAKAPSHPVPKTSKPGHGARTRVPVPRSSTLGVIGAQRAQLSDLLKPGLWMCSSGTTDTPPCHPSPPKFFHFFCWPLHSSQSLNTVPSSRGISLLKFTASSDTISCQSL